MKTRENPYTDPRMKEFFSSLPVYVQESIEQSGVKFDSLSQLQSFAAGLNQPKK